MSIESILKDIRDMKIYLLHYNFLTEDRKTNIKYDERNVIDMDEYDGSSYMPDETELQINNMSLDSTQKMTSVKTRSTDYRKIGKNNEKIDPFKKGFQEKYMAQKFPSMMKKS